ncbi:MAG: carboxymuconolactone decarboxylase family protein [Rhabdochlamydiaceae bacterium]
MSDLNQVQNQTTDEPFLSPVEDPKDPVMERMYAAQKASLGKVLTPTRVHSARLPPAFAEFYGKINELDRVLQLSPEIVLLVRVRVASLNVCLFCIDASRAYTIAMSMNQAKFDALDEYGTSPLFTEAERAVLNYVSELTRDKKVNRVTFDRLAKYYSEREICEIVYLVATEHLYNMTNIGLNINSDMLCDITKK